MLGLHADAVLHAMAFWIHDFNHLLQTAVYLSSVPYLTLCECHRMVMGVPYLLYVFFLVSYLVHHVASPSPTRLSPVCATSRTSAALHLWAPREAEC